MTLGKKNCTPLKPWNFTLVDIFIFEAHIFNRREYVASTRGIYDVFTDDSNQRFSYDFYGRIYRNIKLSLKRKYIQKNHLKRHIIAYNYIFILLNLYLEINLLIPKVFQKIPQFFTFNFANIPYLIILWKKLKRLECGTIDLWIYKTFKTINVL